MSQRMLRRLNLNLLWTRSLASAEMHSDHFFVSRLMEEQGLDESLSDGFSAGLSGIFFANFVN